MHVTMRLRLRRLSITFAVLAAMAAALLAAPPAGAEIDRQRLGEIRSQFDGLTTELIDEIESNWEELERLRAPTALRAGQGFEQPAAVGPVEGQTGPPAIARWDVVPYQTIGGDGFAVGVVAFHIHGIDRVEFSLEGGPWVASHEMSMNPRTGVVEYWFPVDTASLTRDGPVEVRAVAYPRPGRGAARVLEPLLLSSNVQGTLAAATAFVAPTGDDAAGDGSGERPFRTIGKAARSIADAGGGRADGGTIYLLPGDHVLDNDGKIAETQRRWLTITAAPGVPRGMVNITGSASSSGTRVRLLRLANVTVRWDPGTGASPRVRSHADQVPDAVLWLDRVHCKGYGRAEMTAAKCVDWVKARDFPGGRYFTDCLTEDCLNGLTAATFNRGSTSRRIVSDHFQNSIVLINCVAEDSDRAGTGAHADVYQLTNRRLENGIIYGVTATRAINSGQGLYFSNDRNDPLNGVVPTRVDGLAIVDTRVFVGGSARAFLAVCPFNNVLMMRNEIRGGMSASYGPSWPSTSSRGPAFVATDVVLIDPRSQFPEAVDLRPPPPGVEYRMAER